MTPKGTRPPHLRPVGDPAPHGSPEDQIIDSGGREMLDEADPVAAEVWGSALVAGFEGVRLEAELAQMQVPPLEELLLCRCQERGDQHAAVVAAAIASVAPPGYADFAASVASRLRGVVARSASWAGAIGQVTPTRAWVATDVFGDQDSLIIGYRQQGQAGEHSLTVLADHNLAGQAKDAWVGADLDEVVATWGSAGDPHLLLEEAPLDKVLELVRNATAVSDAWDLDTELRSEDFACHRALIWARLRRAGLTNDRPTNIEVCQAERDMIVNEFMASPEGRRLAHEPSEVDIEILAHHLVDLRADYEGRPLRWSPTAVALLLGDLAPRKLLLGPDEAAALPGVLRAFVHFCSGRTGLEPIFVNEILEAVDEMEPRFLDRMRDHGAGRPAKVLPATLQARGVDLSDLDAINEALEYGPMELHEAVPKSGRRATTAPEDVVVSAAQADVLARFEVLAGFYGAGRKLTQTGRPTLADARQLVALLGTKDRLDQTIGVHTFKTTSAAELPELSFMVRWALTAGALRKEHGKLLAAKSWQKLRENPLQRWLKAIDALQSLGPLAGFHARNRYRDPDEILDELAPEILDILRAGPMAFEDVLDWVFERADIEYEWLGPFMGDPEHRRTSFGWDLDRLTRILGWAGIVDRAGAKVKPDPYDFERLVGGTLQLTRVGQWWLTE